MSAQSDQHHAHTNRLAKETSPYLLQHAHNPVDWYAWGPEAFEAARSQNKPIFLSVGYSTCYWCHVMERQSFEDLQIAQQMNQRFINIKVDREERPDVDQLYMTAVQVLTHHGGWPMSVFLTPELQPFYGGTYFPPTDVHGRPGFPTVLRAIAEAYRDRPADIAQSSARLTAILQELAQPRHPEAPMTLGPDYVAELIDRSTADFDAALGGFGSAPKFPRQTLLELLLGYLHLGGSTGEGERVGRIEAMLARTLDAMADGGIRDHLGGGFHRYSTDERWLVPHFEIMLYDNAMLGWVYTEAFRHFEEPRYARVARGIFNFVLREMTSPAGSFYTAFDAEVDSQEGLSYLWTRQEIEQVLSGKFAADEVALFVTTYGLDRGPNFSDPHHGSGTADKSILYLPEPLSAVAARVGMLDEGDLDARLVPMRECLHAHRLTRKQPLLDTKVLTSWNALMIRALAHAGRIFQEDRYLAAAGAAADFLLKHHANIDGSLIRTSRGLDASGGGERRGIAGFLDDYAFLTEALLDLHDAGGQEKRREQAEGLSHRMLEKFVDSQAGGLFFTPADANELIVRQKVGSDSPLPSGNAVAAMALLRLGRADACRDILAAFAAQLERGAEGMSAMVQAALYFLADHDAIAVAAGAAHASAEPSSEHVAAEATQVTARWAAPLELHLSVSIRPPFHLHANPASEGMVPTTLRVSDKNNAQVQAIEYPQGVERKLEFADVPLRVYEGVVTIVVRLLSLPSAPLELALSYQACTDDACLAPVTKLMRVGTMEN